MSNVVGSLRKVTIDGITFSVTADGGFSGPGSMYENSSIPTSGDDMRKMVRRSMTKEGITLICNAVEKEQLKDIADSTDDVTLSVEDAAGNVDRATGWIDYESFESEDGKATVKLFPRSGWTLFAAA